MQAARLIDGVLEIKQFDTPEPEYEEARIRITSAGVCHSDLHIVKSEWRGIPQTMPVGHEAIGVVEALGEGADQFVSVGDRVILGLGGSGGGYWCGSCQYCLSGEPRHCAKGKGIMGVFSEQFCVWAKSLVVLPDSVGDEEAPLACGGLTAYGAIKKLFEYNINPGSTVGIIGAAGGLGHYAIQLCKEFGYNIVGVDLGEERLAFVKEMGADQAMEPAEADTTDKVDAVLVFSAHIDGFQLGLRMLRARGLFVAVGIPPESQGDIHLHPWEFFRKQPTIIYSAVGTVQDMRELVDLAAAGKVKSHIGRTAALSELPQVFEELEAGAYVGRAVITDLGG